jgi:MFS family permease
VADQRSDPGDQQSAAAPPAAPPDRREEAGGWLSRGVVSISAASFFSDAGHEITTSALPGFLTAVLHAGPGALGIIEGSSDALVGLAKLAGGPLANDPARRARLASGGYLATAVATGAVGLAGAVWQVAILRAAGWVGRGLRSPARDMLLTSLTPAAAYGRAIGLERAGDNAGAVAGPLLAAGLIAWLGIRPALLLAFVPGLAAALAITAAARQARRQVVTPAGRRTLTFNLGEMRRAGLARALAAPALFELGNVASTLLILRATGLLHAGGRSQAAAASLAIVLYAAHNAAATGAAVGAGHLADRAGARAVFAAGAAVYIAGYLIFAAGPRAVALLLLGFVLAGTGIGFAETAESTLVAQLLPGRLRASGFGVLGITQAAGGLASSAVAGLLWAVLSPAAGFGYAAAWMVAALAATALTRRPGRH